MPDTTHWIVVRGAGFEPYEVSHEDVKEHLESFGECIHLVPTRVWRDYQKTAERLSALKNELQTYRRASFVVQAALPGYPMPTVKGKENAREDPR